MALRSKFHDTLVLTLAEMCKGKYVDPAPWWEPFGDIAALVVDKADHWTPQMCGGIQASSPDQKLLGGASISADALASQNLRNEPS